MEKRVLVAIVLSFLVLVLYQAIFFKKKPQPEIPAESITEIEKKPEPPPYTKEAPEAARAIQEKEEPAEERLPQVISSQSEEEITIDTSLYQATWSNRGAVLKSWKLKRHKDENEENLELVSRLASEVKIYPFSLRTDDSSFDSLINSTLYQPSNLELVLSGGRTGELRFQFADERGTRVEKILTFQDGKYDFDVEINAWKYGQPIEPHVIWGPGFGNPSPADAKRRLAGGGSEITVYPPRKGDRLSEQKYKPLGKWQDLVSKNKNIFHFIQWVAYENNYFAALFFTPYQQANVAFLREGPEENPYFLLSVTPPEKVYIGPKEYDTLVEFGNEAKRLVRFGMFGFISEILLKTSKYFHSLIPNWGLSIIIITIIIKILFFPLTYTSMRSMSKMQELQPKIKAIRARYKKAKTDMAQRRKMNEEIMKLYKQQGVNPAGGCLPMLIQIPVFFGFFRLLMVAIEFRQSPFILWITDLSARDPFYVTPILMGVTQFISQKMTPTSADPTQAKMMLLMPVIFVILFINFPSGLVLYWLTNNVLQIAQQYIINRLREKEKRKTHGKRRKK
ncbi:MAG: membrane protein insertase YidC [Candidatus Aminicenantes bacterium]|jgi:YidC/Oxa1 family membrane protein insertase